MTNKEAIDRLQRCKRNLELGKVIGAVSEEDANERIDAYDLAIKALEERSHGKWRVYEGVITCEKCGAEADEITPFCAWCGVNMRGNIE